MSSVANRRPFGTAAANSAAIFRSSKGNDRNRKPRSIKSLSTEPKLTQSVPGITSKPKQNHKEKLRKSKTPKMHNLSSRGGAYNFQTEFVEKKLSNDDAAKKVFKPDPSPVKRPDPTSNQIESNPFSTAASPTDKLQSQTAKLTNHRDSFIQSSLGRLFKPSRPFSERRSNTSRCCEREREASSDMDVDSECLTPEKTSPLVTSPYNKPDPEPKESSVAAITHKSRLSNTDIAAKTYAHLKSTIDNASVPSRSTINPTTTDKTQPPDKNNASAAADSNTKSQQPQSQISEEVLQRARNGPADDKRVLDAMLNSSNAEAAPNCNDLTKSEESSLVGSSIGGLSFHRCASVDGSEVTMPSVVHETTHVRPPATIETSSIFRKDCNASNPNNSRNAQRRSNVAAPVNDDLSNRFTRRPTNDERERLSMQIRSQLQSEYTLPSQIYLPAGWQVRMSKSKGKPYYVHPDFGSTWHYPGLIVGPHIAVQNRLYVDEDANRFTSQAFAFHKCNDAIQSTTSILEGSSSSNNVSSSAGRGVIDRSENGQFGKHSSDFVSSVGHRSDDAVNSQTASSKNSESTQNRSHSSDGSTAGKCSDDAVNSQAVSSNGTQSMCLTQDSFVNSYTDNATSPEMKEKVIIDNVREVDSDIHGLALSKESNVTDVATLETERNDNSSSVVEDNLSTTEKVGINFGVKQDSFDEYDIEDNKDESKSTVNDEVDSLLGLDFADKKDVDLREDNNSLASDHVDVEAMLRHGAPSRGSSPLATINEIIQNSTGKKSMSSHVSLDESSLDSDELVKETSPKSTKFQSSLSDDLSQASNDFKEEPSIEISHNHQSFDDGEDDFDSNGFDLGDIGFSDAENPSIDNYDATFDDGLDSVVDASAEQHVTKRKRKRKRKEGVMKERRKTFPPGPLCSLQMLDLVEEGSLNTPLWRNAKRKRCTLTSLKRSQNSKKVRRSSH